MHVWTKWKLCDYQEDSSWRWSRWIWLVQQDRAETSLSTLMSGFYIHNQRYRTFLISAHSRYCAECLVLPSRNYLGSANTYFTCPRLIRKLCMEKNIWNYFDSGPFLLGWRMYGTTPEHGGKEGVFGVLQKWRHHMCFFSLPCTVLPGWNICQWINFQECEMIYSKVKPSGLQYLRSLLL